MKRIFISYSHEDTEFKEKLEKQLRVLELEGFCDIWEDSRIPIGSDWLQKIQTAIDQAEIAVMMVSAGFLTSPFIRGEEIPRMLEQRRNNELTLLPLFVKSCPWDKVQWLSSIQGFPPGNKTLMEMEEAEQLRQLTQFAKHIHDILNNPKPHSRSLAFISGKPGNEPVLRGSTGVQALTGKVSLTAR